MVIVFSSRCETLMVQKTDSTGSLHVGQYGEATCHDYIQTPFSEVCHSRFKAIYITLEINVFITLLIFVCLNFRVLPTAQSEQSNKILLLLAPQFILLQSI